MQFMVIFLYNLYILFEYNTSGLISELSYNELSYKEVQCNSLKNKLCRNKIFTELSMLLRVKVYPFIL